MQTARPVPYRWVVFALLALGYLLVYFHRTSPAVVALDLMRDLKAGAALTGLLGAAYYWPYALMQIPSGLLSDSWGPRRTITASFILAGLASIFFGLVQSAGAAIVARLLVGIGVSLLFVPALKTLTMWFKVKEFALLTGLLMAVGGVGVYTAATPLAALSTLIGWRGSFMAIGGATLLLGAAIWFLVRNRPEEMGYPAPEETTGQAEGGRGIGLWQGMKMVLTAGRLWPLACWYFCTFFIFFSFAALWGGPYLRQVYGLSRVAAGNVLSMMAIAMIVGSPLQSALSDRLGSRKKVLMANALATVVLVLPLALAPAEMSLTMLYVLCFFLGLSASASVVVAFTMAKELFPLEIAGTSVGLANLFPFLGGAVGQWALGYVLQAQGRVGGKFTAAAYGNAFKLYIVCSLLALLMAFLLRDTMAGKVKDQ